MAGLHDRYVFNFWKKLPTCFPIQLYHFTFPSAVCEGFSFSTSLPTAMDSLCVNLTRLRMNIISGYVYEYFSASLAFHSVDCIKKQIHPQPCEQASSNPLMDDASSFELGYPPSPALGIGVAAYQAFGLGLNIPAVFLVLQARRWKIVIVLSLHNHKSQFLEQISSYICVF